MDNKIYHLLCNLMRNYEQLLSQGLQKADWFRNESCKVFIVTFCSMHALWLKTVFSSQTRRKTSHLQICADWSAQGIWVTLYQGHWEHVHMHLGHSYPDREGAKQLIMKVVWVFGVNAGWVHLLGSGGIGGLFLLGTKHFFLLLNRTLFQTVWEGNN